MPKYLWFRAFRRTNLQELLDVLKSGDGPHPDPHCRCRENERALGIDCPCVYAYLGQTLEEFGHSAATVPVGAFDCVVSPFDTGGLVGHIKPVCSWKPEERSDYLGAHTWPVTDLPGLLAAFPGLDANRIHGYLLGEKPPEPGIYAVLDDGLPAVDLWAQNDHWRAWVWEGRSTGPFVLGGNLFRWTCPADLFARLQAEAPALPYSKDWLLFLSKTYVRGGVTALVDELRPYQVTP